MRDHSSDSLPEHAGRSSEMLDTSAWVVTHFLVEEFLELDSVSEERARDVDAFSSHNDDLLSAEEFFSNVGS